MYREKEENIIKGKDKLTEIINKQVELENYITEINEKLKLKGKSRLTAFQRSHEKEELKDAEKNIIDLSLEFANQKCGLEIMEEDLISSGLRKEVRMSRLRGKAIENKSESIKLCGMFTELEKLNVSLLAGKDELRTSKVALIEMQHDLKITRKEIQDIYNPAKQSHELPMALVEEHIRSGRKVSFF